MERAVILPFFAPTPPSEGDLTPYQRHNQAYNLTLYTYIPLIHTILFVLPCHRHNRASILFHLVPVNENGETMNEDNRWENCEFVLSLTVVPLD